MEFIKAANYSTGRPYGIDGICVHHMAGKLTAEQCGGIFANPARRASAHYGIGYNGEVAQYVEEGNRAWASGDGIGRNSRGNDRAIHIEVSNSDYGGEWPVSDASYNALVELVRDIAKRNNLLPLVAGENLFAHRDVQATACPGDYLYSRLDMLATAVNGVPEVPATPTEPVEPVQDNGLPARGWIRRGDNLPLVGRIAKFMYSTFPAYTNKAALGNYYGQYIEASIKEFQRRAKADGKYNDVADGCVGKKTLESLKKYGFRG